MVMVRRGLGLIWRVEVNGFVLNIFFCDDIFDPMSAFKIFW